MGRFDALTQLDKKPFPTTPLSEKVAPVKVVTPSEDQFAGEPASTQTDLHANQQAPKPANMQTRKQVNLQTGKQVFIEKYSSYLTHEYKRELKRIAFESDRNEYEVLLEAVEHYLARKK